MNTRQVLLAAVVVGIVGGMMALPWLICWHSLSVGCKPDHNQSTAGGGFRYDGKTFDQWKATWAKELKADRRVETLWAMTAFGTHGFGKEAAEVVIEMVREHCKDKGADQAALEQDAVFKEARTALVRIGPASSLALLECLRDPDRNVSPFAIIFMEVELHPTAVPVLVKLVQGDNPEWSILALQTLGNTLQKKTLSAEIDTALSAEVKKGKNARKFLDTLQRAFAVDKTRRSAVVVMGALGTTAQPVVEPLLDFVQEKSLRENRGSKSIPQVRTADGTPTDDVDLCLMIEALGRIQGDAGRTLPMLAGIISNKTEQDKVRSCAVKALTEFGPQAVSATSTLVDALDDSICCEAIEALGKVQAGPAWVVPRLMQAITREIDVPARVALVSGSGGPAKSASPTSASTRRNMKFVKCSLDYLSKVGPQASDAVPVLVQLFRKVEEVRPQVVAVLDKMGPVARFEAERLGNELRGVDTKNLPVPTVEISGGIKPVSFSADDSIRWKPAATSENQINNPPAKSNMIPRPPINDQPFIPTQAVPDRKPQQAPIPVPAPQFNPQPPQAPPRVVPIPNYDPLPSPPADFSLPAGQGNNYSPNVELFPPPIMPPPPLGERR